MSVHSAPDNLHIRAARPADIASIAAAHVASWRETYVGIVDQRLIDERTLDMRITQWRAMFEQPGRITLVAHDGAALQGFASALVLHPPVNGFDSYLQLLYLIRAAKGRGTGAALLREIAGRLIGAGCRRMALRVVRENPARGFYERFGAQLSPVGLALDAGTFDDVVYVFPDLHLLIAHASGAMNS